MYLRKKPDFFTLYYWSSLTLAFPRKHPIAAWKERYNLDTDPQISTSKQTSCAKHTFGFLHHRHQCNECHTKATTEAKAPLFVGSTQWLCCISSRSDWAGNPGVLKGHICPISSVSHPGWRGHNGKSSHFPVTFPYKGLWEKAPGVPSVGSSPQQDAPQAVSTSAAFRFPLLHSAASRPQPKPRPHSSTLFRHNPQAPPKSTHVYQIRAWVVEIARVEKHRKPKSRHLACTHHWAGGVGVSSIVKWWPGSVPSVMLQRWCLPGALEKTYMCMLFQEQLFHVWDTAADKMGQAEIWLPARGLTCWWLKVMQSVSQGQKTHRWRKGGNWR